MPQINHENCPYYNDPSCIYTDSKNKGRAVSHRIIDTASGIIGDALDFFRGNDCVHCPKSRVDF